MTHASLLTSPHAATGGTLADGWTATNRRCGGTPGRWVYHACSFHSCTGRLSRLPKTSGQHV